MTLHHGIDVAAARAAARRPLEPAPSAATPGAFTYVHVANRRPEKAHQVLLDAFVHAAAADPALHLWLVGQRLDDPELPCPRRRSPGP